ncbi:hypothetical protein ACA910_017575 [Epithemia clementina (nom. ined.)]
MQQPKQLMLQQDVAATISPSSSFCHSNNDQPSSSGTPVLSHGNTLNTNYSNACKNVRQQQSRRFVFFRSIKLWVLFLLLLLFLNQVLQMSLNNNVLRKINIIQQLHQQQESSAAYIPHQRDFCVEGYMKGQTFNKIIILGHALWYSSCLSSQSSSLTSIALPINDDDNLNSDFQSVVRLDQHWMEFYNEWFEPDSSKILPLYENDNDNEGQNNNQTAFNCGTIHPVRDIFHTPLSDADLEGCPHPSNYRSGVQLLPSLKHEYLEAADSVFDGYKQEHAQQQQQEGQEAQPDPIVVTVHQRWLEGSCPDRAADPLKNSCPRRAVRIEQLDDGAAMPETQWGFTCFYNETLVRQQIPGHVLQGRSAFDKNQVIVVLLGDGQRDDSPEVQTFMHYDQSNFTIQIGMMVSSEYHFGNPMSTVDRTVAILRARRGLRQYPESCYGAIWRESEEERESQENRA